ncbi:MAG: membrane integrity-associated transporter subunit PqiC [Bacteroidales bacterium]|nr:membrane integrity-associated transporter subunit PqiC [Bacteroidales bacterium]
MKQFVVISLFLTLVSCLSEKTVTRKYYTIETPGEISAPDTRPESVIPGICEIQRPVVDPVFEKNQIANRRMSHEISYYMYHQWAVRPADAIWEFVYDVIRQSGLFREVSVRYSRMIPEYKILTSVHKLEVVEINKSMSAHIDIGFRLVLNSNDSILVEHRADRTEDMEEKNMNLFASEISEIIFEELMTFSLMIGEKKQSLNSVEVR